MKQFATFLLLLVIMIPLAETAHAKDEIITYEQLLAIDEPCTVYVEGKTGDPYPMHMKETLMSSTQWQWLIKDSSGKYRPSGKYVNMTAYQAMGISKRGLILNHKDCLYVCELPIRTTVNISTVSGSNAARVVMCISCSSRPACRT